MTPRSSLIKRIAWPVASAALALGLAACGGVGNVSAPAGGVTLSGVAATGAAITGQTVSVKCASGAGSATTGAADGSFQVTIASGAGPCMLQVTDPLTGAKLHSWASASGVVNVTPLTEAAVGVALGGTNTASAFAAFSAASVTDAALAAAETRIKTFLKSKGIDTAALTGSVFTQAFQANSVGVDKILDDLKKAGFSGSYLTADLLANVPCTATTLAAFNTTFGGKTVSGSLFPLTGYSAKGTTATVTIGTDGGVTLGSAGQKIVFDKFCTTGGYAGFPAGIGSTVYIEATQSAAQTTPVPAYAQFYLGKDGNVYINDLTLTAGFFSSAITTTAISGGGGGVETGGTTTPASDALAGLVANGLTGKTFDGGTSDGSTCSFSISAAGDLSVKTAGVPAGNGAGAVPANPVVPASILQAVSGNAKQWLYQTDSNQLGDSVMASLNTSASAFDGVAEVDMSVSAIRRTSGSLSQGVPISCSTGNSAARKTAKLAPYVGTWIGVVSTGSTTVCTTTVAANGAMTFTRTNSGVTGGKQVFTTNAITGPTPGSYHATFDKLGDGTLLFQSVSADTVQLPAFAGGLSAGTSYIDLRVKGTGPAFGQTSLRLLFNTPSGTNTGDLSVDSCVAMQKQ